MDDGNKINDDLIKIKNSFLKQGFKNHDSKSRHFDLEEEFAKTKKNRNIIYKLSFICFITLVITGTWFLTGWINERSRKINISIDDFKDISLKDLLTSTKRYENQLVLVKDELDDANFQKESELQAVQDQTKKLLELAGKRRLTDEKRNKLIKDIKSDEWKKMLEIRNKYAKIIKDKQNEIANLKEEISKFDSNKISQAMQHQDVLSSEDKIAELQTNRMIKFYEDKIKRTQGLYEQKIKDRDSYYKELLALTVLKYNPKFKDDEEITNFLGSEFDPKNDGSGYKISDQTIYNEYIDELKLKGITNDEKFKSIIKENDERNRALEYLNSIPFENAVPELIQRLNIYDKSIMNEYRYMLYNLVTADKTGDGTAAKQDEMLKNYILAVGSVLDKSAIPSDKKYAGYVLNPSNNNDIVISLGQDFVPKDGQAAYILSRSSGILSKVSFIVNENGVKIKLLEMKDKINPLDLIVVGR